jgi:hypothetical protein
LRIIPRKLTIDAAEAELSSALVAMVVGTRSAVSPAQVLDYLSSHFQVVTSEVRVRRSRPDDFLLFFNDGAVADRVLHAPSPAAGVFSLRFRRWRRLS